jgi:hypothetical protein
MKNSYTAKFYKAYTLWKSTLKDDKKYQGYKKSLDNKTSGENSLTGVVGSKLLKLDWVERIEEALPFMDTAIRDSRSFIEQRDEIVPIEKVKRINTQSVRHLAQHTNLIAKVEANGDVLPNSILNIYYESSFAIYENRFLYTLLTNLTDFVEKRYRVLKNKDQKIDINYTLDKTVKRKSKVSKMTVNFEHETSESEKFDHTMNTSNLSGFTRVLRIRSIISDFWASKLIQSLKGIEFVRPPIVRTNLMTKNVNFRNCLELYEYIERYTSLGYKYDNKKYTGDMPKSIDDNLKDIFIFGNFLSEITFNAQFAKDLKKDYKDLLKQEKAEAKHLNKIDQQKQKEKIKQIVENKLQKQSKVYNKKIDVLNNKNQRMQNRYDKLKEKYEQLKQKNKQFKTVRVAGYTKKDGTKVAPYVKIKKPKKKQSRKNNEKN